jgi:hypothetical protein
MSLFIDWFSICGIPCYFMDRWMVPTDEDLAFDSFEIDLAMVSVTIEVTVNQ